MKSKTGTSDDNLLLDNSWVNFFPRPLWALRRQGGCARVWNFSYHDLSKRFEEACQDLELQDITL